ncbi:unnamed protein product [Caenorhabditis bovis]|uniref:Uncharacterized protein n=1 Tax=Caenorhabditis bovis TaxID=2654633 RepID=A0A8S1EE05_9PELO|nr:unnamed protein product [Caenorhabditis bovis]
MSLKNPFVYYCRWEKKHKVYVPVASVFPDKDMVWSPPPPISSPAFQQPLPSITDKLGNLDEFRDQDDFSSFQQQTPPTPSSPLTWAISRFDYYSGKPSNTIIHNRPSLAS